MVLSYLPLRESMAQNRSLPGYEKILGCRTQQLFSRADTSSKGPQ